MRSSLAIDQRQRIFLSTRIRAQDWAHSLKISVVFQELKCCPLNWRTLSELIVNHMSLVCKQLVIRFCVN